VKKKYSIERIVTNPKQAGVGIPAVRSVLIGFKALAAKSASLYLILCIVFNLWINRERASTYIAQCGASLTELRFTNGRPEYIPAPDAPADCQGFHAARVCSSGGNGILQNVGLAVFVSGLTSCLPQDSPKQPPPADQCASLRESNEYRLAGERRRFPLYLAILAGVFLCGLISWGDTEWLDRR
jgi:hypothetical protein